MFKEWLNRDSTPNKFTLAMGELIRQAREEKKWSQEQLAEAVYKRRASISEIENGKMVPDAVTLFLMGLTLNKPFNYFIPKFYRNQLPDEANLSVEEQELLLEFRRIPNERQKRLAISQVKAIADLD